MTATIPADGQHPVAESLAAQLGLDSVEIRYGLSQDELFVAALAHDRGRIRPDGPDDEPKAHGTSLGLDGPLVYYSDPSCTGRPVQDTFAVARDEIADEIWWKPDFQRFEPDHFGPLLERVVAHLNERRATLFTTDVFCGADPDFAIPYRFVGEYATHAYFANIMFPSDIVADADRDEVGWTMLNVPSFECDAERDGTLSGRAVIMDFHDRIGVVLGRADYCGVVKKTMFTVMNFVLPGQGQLTMHCSANVGRRGDAAILFGLSGTGKTTLSADPDRKLIGDDEHVWTDAGIANFEAGCYAKLIDLDKEAEPIIAAALSMKGTLIENVPPLPGRSLADTDPQELDLTDGSTTENTRFAYPLSCNPDVADGARGPHPESIVLLTADAFGVIPPVSILDPDEVLYHFVTGFTSKLAGTEVGVTEPQATFSACFGAPFMSRPPSIYAQLLADRMRAHRTRCILLNTGWSGGPADKADRISIAHTRALLDAALDGSLDDVETERHPILGLAIPLSCPGVPDEILNPRNMWGDAEAYDETAARLRRMFEANYADRDFGALGVKPVM